MKRALYLLPFLFAVILNAQINKSGINIASHSVTAPVFIGRANNIIKIISADVRETVKDNALNEICFETDKFSSIGILKSLRFFSVIGAEMQLIKEADKFNKTKIILKFNYKLNKGINSFKVNVEINENTPLDSLLKIKCAYIKINNKKHIIDDKFQSFRIGHILRKPGDDNAQCYRIPGIITTNTGALIAVYDIRKNSCRDLPGDIDIGARRSSDKGETWGPTKTILDMGEAHDQNGAGDPSILVDRQTGTIWVAGLWSHGSRGWNGSGQGLSPDETGQFILVKSDDDGVSWSEPINITNQVKNKSWKLFFQGPGNGISLRNGTLVFPAQFRDSSGTPYSTIIYSLDHGASWKSDDGAKANTTEAQVVELQNGNLMLNMRDNRGGYRSIAVTSDLGKSWIEHKTSRSELIEPVCMASFIRIFDEIPGKRNPVLAFSNPNSKINRDSITIKFSVDDGDNWNKMVPMLRVAPILIDERESFGYSCLTKIDEKYLGLLYEGTGELYFVKIKLPDILYKVDINDFPGGSIKLIKKNK